MSTYIYMYIHTLYISVYIFFSFIHLSICFSFIDLCVSFLLVHMAVSVNWWVLFVGVLRTAALLLGVSTRPPEVSRSPGAPCSLP